MAKDAEQARTIEARIRALQKEGRAGGLISSVRSAAEILPEHRALAVAEAKKLKSVLTPKLKSELKPDDRKLVDRALEGEALVPVSAAQIPDVLVAGLRERDGRMDRNVLVFPKTGVGTWDAKRMKAFTDDLREAARDRRRSPWTWRARCCCPRI